MRLDHVSYAVSHNELADTVQRLGASLGASFIDGGRHPRFGTRNFILPLKNGTYFEVVAALDHPAADQAAFGQAVRAVANQGGGWLGWVVSTSDITTVEARIGRSAVDGHRTRPDGFDLQWKQIGVLDIIDNAQLPFFIEWISSADQHPSNNPSSVSLKSIEISGDEKTITEYLGEPTNHPLDDIDIIWVKGETPGIVAVTFETAHGAVRID
ncbi:MAG: hypothetical protein RL410_1271 [Actinomycetota bacterium]|jgi:hypothetical protein